LQATEVSIQLSKHNSAWSGLNSEYLNKYREAIEDIPEEMLHRFENEDKSDLAKYEIAARMCEAAYEYDEESITELAKDEVLFEDGEIFRVPHSNSLSLKMVYAKGFDVDENILYFGFRGSTTSGDWVTNFIGWELDNADAKVPELKVHQGFWNASNDTFKDLVGFLRKIKKGNQATIFLCGHSLGGAVASLVGYRMNKSGYNVRVITFGSAAVVSIPQFGEDFVTSIILKTDPVPVICFHGVKLMLGLNANSTTRFYPAGKLVDLKSDDLARSAAEEHGIKNYIYMMASFINSNNKI
jgi:hypothetical protein